MRADNLKLIFTYLICGFVVAAGFFIIYQAAVHELPAGSDRAAVYTMVGGFVGAVIQFVTGNEIATRTANQAVRSFNTGSTSVSPTVTAESPTTMTVAPTPPPEEHGDGG